MPKQQWDEWIAYAKLESRKKIKAENEKIISDIEQKEYKEEVLRLAARRNAETKQSAKLVSKDDDIGKKIHSSVELQPNKLQWTNISNDFTPPSSPPLMISNTAFSSKSRSESPLVIAKALVSTIHSEYSDMKE